MAENSSRITAPEPLLAAWIKWTMDFWEAMAQMGPGPAGTVKAGDGTPNGAAPIDSCLAALSLWQAFFSLLTEPGTVTAVFQDIKAPSEIILKMAQSGWQGYCHLHRQWLQGWQGDGAPAETGDYDTLDQDIIKTCHDLCEHEFASLLDLPHLQLRGGSPERLHRATDTFNQFQAALAEFIYLLARPVKKSLQAMGGGPPPAAAAQPPEDFKEYYRKWLRILQGYYMTLFQSAEFTQTLGHFLHALEDFTMAKQDLIADAIEALGWPSRRDMDELYRELYQLKKNMKAMAKKLDQPVPVGKEP